MIRICFVCHGNICRSPMAEFVMKSLVKEKGMEKSFFITSRATHTDEIWGDVGNPIYPPAQKELEKHNIPFGDKRAQLLENSDGDKYDYFIGMDSENIRYMTKILGIKNRDKIYKLMSFAGFDESVSDPWYTRDFDRAYNDIYIGCKALFEEVTK